MGPDAGRDLRQPVMQIAQQELDTRADLSGDWRSSDSRSSSLARPCGTTMPRSRRRKRIWFMSEARSATRRSRTRCSVCMSSRSSLLSATKRIVGRVAACLGILVVILLGFDIGPHMLGRHQPHLVALGGQCPAHVVGAASQASIATMQAGSFAA